MIASIWLYRFKLAANQNIHRVHSIPVQNGMANNNQWYKTLIIMNPAVKRPRQFYSNNVRSFSILTMNIWWWFIFIYILLQWLLKIYSDFEWNRKNQSHLFFQILLVFLFIGYRYNKNNITLEKNPEEFHPMKSVESKWFYSGSMIFANTCFTVFDLWLWSILKRLNI